MKRMATWAQLGAPGSARIGPWRALEGVPPDVAWPGKGLPFKTIHNPALPRYHDGRVFSRGGIIIM